MSETDASAQADRPGEWPGGATLALAFALSVGSLDAMTTLLTRPARFAVLSGVAVPLAATAVASLATWLLAFLLLKLLAQRAFGSLFVPLSIALAGAATALFTLVGLTGLFKWPLFLTDLFKLALLSAVAAALAVGLYAILRSGETQPAVRATAAAMVLALPFLLVETTLVLWLNFYRLGRFFAAESLGVNAAFLAAVTVTVALAYRRAVRSVPRALLALLALVLATALTHLAPTVSRSTSVAKPKPRPGTRSVRRILLVSVDTLRADALSCYGARSIETPQSDRLARDGILFERALSPAPWTPPAMASVLTGTTPDVHLVVGTESRVPDRLPTLAEHLRNAGYRTAAVGESAVLAPVRSNFSKGFEEYDFYPRLPADGSLGTRLVSRFGPDAYRVETTADRVTELAESWLQQHRGEDFFLWIHYFDPHIPYRPPEEEARLAHVPPSMGRLFSDAGGIRTGHYSPSLAERDWIRALYAGEVLYVDRALGRLWERLRRLELYDDTLIVLTADHGEEFWEHGGFGHGQSLFNELLWVPLIVKPPHWASPLQVATRVSTEDIVPSILDLAGLAYPADRLSGRSLRALWDSGAARFEERARVAGAVATFEPRVGVTFEGFKYVRSLVTGREELYDLAGDWGEQASVASGRPDLVARARRLLEEEEQRAGTLRALYGITRAEQVEVERERLEQLRALGYVR